MKFKLLFITFLLVLNSSCSKEKDEKVLTITVRQKILVGEPARAGTFYEERIIRQIYETLYEYSCLEEHHEVKPLLADGMPQVSKDGLTYTIKIKQGINFADDACFKQTKGKGREITAQDFVYSLEYFAASPPFSKADFFYYIDGLAWLRDKAKKSLSKGVKLADFVKDSKASGLKILDKYTVQIKLTQPCPYFIETLMVPGASIIPIEAVEYYGEEFNAHPVGTGPFILKDWGKGENVVLVKNPNYRHDRHPDDGSENSGKALPLIDKVVIKYFKTEIGREVAFNHCEVDMYSPEQESFYDYFPKKDELDSEFKMLNVQVAKVVNPRFMGILFNMSEPLIGRNKDLRKAITYAFDNAKNIDVFFYERPMIANWIIPPHVFGYDEDYKNPYKYDLSDARKLLEKAGYPDGQGLPELTLLMNNNALMKRIGNFFVDSMSKIGVGVKLEFVDTPEKIKHVVDSGKTKVHLFVISEQFSDTNPEVMLRTFYKGSVKYKTNYAGYYNPEYERLYEKICSMSLNAERLKIMGKMRDIVMDDYVVMPMSFSVSYRLYYGYVHNYKPHAIMMDRYKYIDVDMKEKKHTLKLVSKKGR